MQGALLNPKRTLTLDSNYAAGASGAGADSATGAGSLAAGATSADGSATTGATAAGTACDLYDEGRNLNIFVPHTGHVPFAAGRPFFVITIWTL